MIFGRGVVTTLMGNRFVYFLFRQSRLQLLIHLSNNYHHRRNVVSAVEIQFSTGNIMYFVLFHYSVLKIG